MSADLTPSEVEQVCEATLAAIAVLAPRATQIGYRLRQLHEIVGIESLDQWERDALTRYTAVVTPDITFRLLAQAGVLSGST